MRFSLCVVAAASLASPLAAETLVDQLWIVDDFAYEQGVIVSAIGGRLAGADYDSQVVDDFTVPDPGYTITDVWFDYLCFLGGEAPPASLIEVFPDIGGRPGEIAVAHAFAQTTSEGWTPTIPGLKGERHHASDLNVRLPAGHYWISMQPITLAVFQGGHANGDIYYPLQDTSVAPVFQTFFREPGIDPDVNHDGALGFGPLLDARRVPDFISTQEEGLDAGDTSFRVDGVVSPPLLGDCDGDGDVDRVDYGGLYSCLLGPGAEVATGCECFDLDINGDIDVHDFAALQISFSN